MPISLSDEDRETIRKLSDAVKRQQEALAAKVEGGPMQTYMVHYSHAYASQSYLEKITARHIQEAEAKAEELCRQKFLAERFVKVWPA